MSKIPSHYQCSLKTFLNCMKIMAATGTWKKSPLKCIALFTSHKDQDTHSTNTLCFNAIMSLPDRPLLRNWIQYSAQQGSTGGIMVSSGQAGGQEDGHLMYCILLANEWSLASVLQVTLTSCYRLCRYQSLVHYLVTSGHILYHICVLMCHLWSAISFFCGGNLIF